MQLFAAEYICAFQRLNFMKVQFQTITFNGDVEKRHHPFALENINTLQPCLIAF